MRTQHNTLQRPDAEELVAIAGLHLLTVHAPPGVAAPVVADIVIADPAEPPDCAPGDLVLAIGFCPSTDATARLLASAQQAGAAAVAVKPHGAEPAALAELAASAGIALVAVPAEMSWAQLAALLRTALATVGLHGEPLVDSVPLGNLFVLADAVAGMVGGAVTIEDPHSRVLAYSRVSSDVDEPRRMTILGQRVPEEFTRLLTERGVFRMLYGGTDVVHVDPEPGLGLRRRLAVAVHAGDEILGSIWVAEGGEPLRSDAEEALRAAARLAPLHLLRHRTALAGDQLVREELVRALLTEGAVSESAATQLGIDLTAPAAVLGFELDGAPLARGALQRLTEMVSIPCAAYHRGALPVTIGARAYVLLAELATPTGHPPDALLALARDAAEHASRRLGTVVRAGVGRVVATAADAPDSRIEADRVLRALAIPDRVGPSAARWADLAASAVLVEVLDLFEERSHLQDGPVQALAAYDDEHQSDLLASLRAYLDAFGDVRSAAGAVQVHPNTFRYRLGRITEVAGIDLDDPEQRLVAALHLRLRDRTKIV